MESMANQGAMPLTTCAAGLFEKPKSPRKNNEKRSKKVSFKDLERIPSGGSNPKAKDLGCDQNGRKPVVRQRVAAKPVHVAAAIKNRKPFVRITSRKISQSEGGPILKKDGVHAANADVFSKPELNTALGLAERIQSLEMENFDGRAAVEARLAESTATRHQLEKASLRPLNIGRDRQLYDGVAHLSFNEDALLMAAAEEREAKAKAVLPTPRPRDPEPRLDDYLADDAIQREFVRLTELKLDDLDFGQLTTAPRSAAYTLYRHQRMWHDRFS